MYLKPKTLYPLKPLKKKPRTTNLAGTAIVKLGTHRATTNIQITPATKIALSPAIHTKRVTNLDAQKETINRVDLENPRRINLQKKAQQCRA